MTRKSSIPKVQTSGDGKNTKKDILIAKGVKVKNLAEKVLEKKNSLCLKKKIK